MAPKNKKSRAGGGAVHDCGAPYGKVTGEATQDPYKLIDKKLNVPGTFWPDHTKAEKAKCWRVSIKDYVARFP